MAFAPHVSYPEYLARCALGDLFLDTLPYNAGATASDVLWAGLPLVTRVGHCFAGRMAASVLMACGLSELIVESEAASRHWHYDWRPSLHAWRKIRAMLREYGRTSALFDAARCACHLEEAYRQMWRRSCEGLAPASFAIPELAPSLTAERHSAGTLRERQSGRIR